VPRNGNLVIRMDDMPSNVAPNLGQASVGCDIVRIGDCVAVSQGQGKEEHFMKLKTVVTGGASSTLYSTRRIWPSHDVNRGATGIISAK